MNSFLQFSENNLWGELWPEITLALGAVFVLLVDLFSKNKNGSKNICGIFAVLFQAVPANSTTFLSAVD